MVAIQKVGDDESRNAARNNDSSGAGCSRSKVSDEGGTGRGGIKTKEKTVPVSSNDRS